MTRNNLWLLALLAGGGWAGAGARGQDYGSIVGWGGQSYCQMSLMAA